VVGGVVRVMWPTRQWLGTGAVIVSGLAAESVILRKRPEAEIVTPTTPLTPAAGNVSAPVLLMTMSPEVVSLAARLVAWVRSGSACVPTPVAAKTAREPAVTTGVAPAALVTAPVVAGRATVVPRGATGPGLRVMAALVRLIGVPAPVTVTAPLTVVVPVPVVWVTEVAWTAPPKVRSWALETSTALSGTAAVP